MTHTESESRVRETLLLRGEQSHFRFTPALLSMRKRFIQYVFVFFHACKNSMKDTKLQRLAKNLHTVQSGKPVIIKDRVISLTSNVDTHDTVLSKNNFSIK